jgi:ParB family chromosome partitioning protein
MADETKPRLGRGLAALLGDLPPPIGVREIDQGLKQIPIAFLRPNPRNPRCIFDETDLSDLVESIREKGIIQPILARKISSNNEIYEIIAGERRWRAAQRAGLHEAPVLIIEASDKQTLELAIIENVQRADLNPIEEALGYQQLLSEFSYTQADLSKVIGKSRSHVTNMLRLLKLSDETRALLHSGAITAGHARAVLSTRDPDGMAQIAAKKGLSVREIERIAREDQSKRDGKSTAGFSKRTAKDPNIALLERDLSEITGLSVIIEHRNQSGRIIVGYENMEQLESILSRFKLCTT